MFDLSLLCRVYGYLVGWFDDDPPWMFEPTKNPCKFLSTVQGRQYKLGIN